VVPWQLIDEPSSAGLTRDTISEAAWWIDADGRPHRGHRAIGEAVATFGGAWSVLGRLVRIQPFEWLAAGVYSVVARNRHRLPGSTPARVPGPTEGRKS
jgi:predicted DCC family thiol-disulfide oxidoreductase YuxK